MTDGGAPSGGAAGAGAVGGGREHDAGPVEALPDDRCTAVAGGAAVVVRTSSGVRAFVNVCGHQESPIDGGWIHDGRLVCPNHFWAFDPVTGENCREGAGLQPLPVEVVDGRVRVTVPGAAPAPSLREQMLAHARTWRRDDPTTHAT